MKTSYFAKIKNSSAFNQRVHVIPEQCFAISNGVPNGYGGNKYQKLVPPWPMVQAFKSNGDVERFSGAYKHAILKELDPEEVYQDLGEDAILICWEGKDKFCHRHLVARWLENALGITITEL